MDKKKINTHPNSVYHPTWKKRMGKLGAAPLQPVERRSWRGEEVLKMGAFLSSPNSKNQPWEHGEASKPDSSKKLRMSVPLSD
ncbi:hypothetical protein E2562_003180 [Oryza meyeriana var. granulata]|uniref:Uncharacterized protein n=1 Tax=Oryza meyeriana var. granulata TaxID=110450 RepID=A0A6G1EUP0_9ORYZ|nr:hypothetical protein E2562_003180 [Oryza meyeriana var. granulata]